MGPWVELDATTMPRTHPGATSNFSLIGAWNTGTPVTVAHAVMTSNHLASVHGTQLMRQDQSTTVQWKAPAKFQVEITASTTTTKITWTLSLMQDATITQQTHLGATRISRNQMVCNSGTQAIAVDAKLASNLLGTVPGTALRQRTEETSNQD